MLAWMVACLVRSWRGASAAGSMRRCSPRYVQDLQGSLDAPQRPNSLARPVCRVRAAYETAGVLGRSWPRRERVGVSLVSWASSWRGLKLTAHRPSGIMQRLVVGGGLDCLGGWLVSRARVGGWTVVGNGQGRFQGSGWMGGWRGWMGWMDGRWDGEDKRDTERHRSSGQQWAAAAAAAAAPGQLQAGRPAATKQAASLLPWAVACNPGLAGPRASNPWARSG